MVPRSPARVGVAHARAVMVLCDPSAEQPMKRVERFAEGLGASSAMFAAQRPPPGVVLGECRILGGLVMSLSGVRGRGELGDRSVSWCAAVGLTSDYLTCTSTCT